MYRGFMLGILASALWGVTPIFFKWMTAFGAVEIVAHRTVWTVVAMMVIAYFTHRIGRLRIALTTWGEFRSLAVSAALMATNWLTFIYAVSTDQIIEASLGYYIYPMMVVAVGVVVLGEKLSRKEWIAVLLALIGVCLKAYENGGAPIIALLVSISFTVYTLLGKTRETGPVVGLLAEAIVLMPMAAGYLIYLALIGDGQFIDGGMANTGLALVTGVITAVPIVMYIVASRKIGMAVAGLLFYLAPSLQLLIGVVIYDEPFSNLDGFAFGLIWLALVILAWPRKAPT